MANARRICLHFARSVRDWIRLLSPNNYVSSRQWAPLPIHLESRKPPPFLSANFISFPIIPVLITRCNESCLRGFPSFRGIFHTRLKLREPTWNLHGSYTSRSLCYPTHSNLCSDFFFSSSITHEFSRIRWNAIKGKVDGHALTRLAICKAITANVGNANWIFPAIGCRAAATNSVKIEYLSQSTTRLSRRWWSFDQWSVSMSAPVPKRVNDGNECKVAVGSKNHRVKVFSPFRMLNESLSSNTITMHRIYLQINDAFTITFRNV